MATDPTPAAPPATSQRIIPGFKAAPVPEKKSRSRPKKAAKSTNDVAAAVDADSPALIETAPTGLSPALVAPASELEEVEEKKASAVEAVQKRIRAANKKIQRIEGYEQKSESLNADQQKAIASKPSLEAVIKELQELLVILKAEEQEELSRISRVKAAEARRHAQDVQVAIAQSKVEEQSEKIVLFQFLHLYGLFTQTNTGFAPPVLPSVIANARANDVATVRMLYEKFSNGPISGGDDALDALAKIAAGSPDIALLDVTFARIKELIAGLTSPPEPAPVTESSLPAGPNDSTAALVEGVTETPAPSFLQASELSPDLPAQQSTTSEKVANWAEEVEEQRAAPQPAAPPPIPAESGWGVAQESTPSVPTTNGQHPSIGSGPAAPDPHPPADQAWGAPTATPSQGLDWSEEHSTDLPPLEGLAPNPPAGAPIPEVSNDGFQQARGSRRGHGGGQPFRERRNDSSWGPRDENARGGFRNYSRNASNGDARPPYSGGERGSFRGGRGRGRGRGAGGPRPNGNSSANESPAAAPQGSS